MTDDAKPDYTTMSGAEFKRAVGADPEKWAQRFLDAFQAYVEGPTMDTAEERQAFVTAWFRDAMEAAVKAALLAPPNTVTLDELLNAPNIRASEDPERDENRRRARVAREHEVARRDGAEPSE